MKRNYYVMLGLCTLLVFAPTYSQSKTADDLSDTDDTNSVVFDATLPQSTESAGNTTLSATPETEKLQNQNKTETKADIEKDNLSSGLVLKKSRGLSVMEQLFYQNLPEGEKPLRQYGYSFFQTNGPTTADAANLQKQNMQSVGASNNTQNNPGIADSLFPEQEQDESTPDYSQYGSFNQTNYKPLARTVGSDYIAGPGDVFQLFLWGSAVEINQLQSSYTLTVEADGTILFAPAGPLPVAGLTLKEIEKVLKSQLEKRYRQVELSLTVRNIREFPLYIAGFVANPGTVSATAVDTLFQVLTRAGGILKNGSLRDILLTRKNGEQLHVDLYDLLLKGKDVDIQVKEGDSILIPAIGTVAGIRGQVHQPGIFEIKEGETLADLYTMAGKSLSNAFLRDSSLTQYAQDERVRVDGDLQDASFSGRVIHNGDILRVGRVREDERNLIHAKGNFKFPGNYSLDRYTSLKTLLENAKLNPETNLNYGRIYRTLPGGIPDNLTFSPQRVLDGIDDISLKERDEVWLYTTDWFPKTTEIDQFPNTIFISGTVLLNRILAWYDGQMLSSVLDKKSFIVDTNRQYAEILRTTESGQQTIMMFSPEDVVAKKQDFALQPGDQIEFFPQYIFSPIHVAGNALSEGKIVPYYPDMTLIDLASSVSMLYDIKNVKASILSSGGEWKVVYLEEEFGADSTSFVKLNPGDSVTFEQLLVDERQKNVVVRGEVQKGGSIIFENNLRLSDALMRAGGFTSEAYPKAIVILRQSVADSIRSQIDQNIAILESSMTQLDKNSSMGSDAEVVNMQLALASQKTQLANLKATYGSVLGRVSVEMPDTLEELKGSKYDILLEKDDQIIIPRRPDYVSIIGAVTNTFTMNYTAGIKVKDLFKAAGWASSDADINKAYIVRASGRVVSALNRSYFLIRPTILNDELEPGDLVYVPQKPQRVSVAIPVIKDVSSIISDVLSSSVSVLSIMKTLGLGL